MKNSHHTNWHYPRTDLAKKVLHGFREGLADRITFFAPRRRGKTEFVRRDIAPMAQEMGILVVYVDFWRDKTSPAAAFATAVMAARREQEDWFTNLLARSELKAKLELFGGGLTLEASQGRSQAEKSLVEAAFQELEATKKPVLLLLDEVQHLATEPSFSDFTAALRGFMTGRSDNRVKGIFTGSSQEGLAQLFKRTKAPFYNSSSMYDFPDLGEDFVEFELKVFEKVTGGVVLDQAVAMETFESLMRAPGRFTDLLKRMALEGVHSIEEGVSLYAEMVLEEENVQFRSAWDDFLPIDKAILMLISMGECRGMYGAKYAEKLKSVCSEDINVSKHAIQNAVNRLKGGGVNAIYSIEHGVWKFTDPAFEQFVRAEAESL